MKKFISIFTFISVILSIIYCLTTRKIWEGEFQIVLDGDTNNSIISSKLNIFCFAFSAINSSL